MKLPPSNTIRYKCLELLYRRGPLSGADASDRLPRFTKDGVHKAMQDAYAKGEATREKDPAGGSGYVYYLSKKALEHFDLCNGCSDYIPEIVPPREAYGFTPEMRGYEASMRRNWRAA